MCMAQERATNTITTADRYSRTKELASMWYALREGLCKTIATDSAAVLYQIHNMLHRPAQTSNNEALQKQGAHRAGCCSYVPAHTTSTHLQKVKAHTGLPGSALADEAARHATRPTQYRPDDMPNCSTDPQPPVTSPVLAGTG
jgi:ribonuclease HI